MNRLTRRATLGAATAFALTQGAAAQGYPSKPVRFLVPYPVGGIVDIVTCAVAEPMQVDLGQPVVVEPKPGGNSTLATAMIPQSPADGYNWVSRSSTARPTPASSTTSTPATARRSISRPSC
jgi:tripartite-type tricarboxylate transporter receptor subunit TctC